MSRRLGRSLLFALALLLVCRQLSVTKVLHQRYLGWSSASLGSIEKLVWLTAGGETKQDDELDRLCISNDNAVKSHPLYAKAEFLAQAQPINEEIQNQYSNILQFLQERNLTRIIIYGLRVTDLTHQWIHFGWFRSWLDILLEAKNEKTPLSLCWIDKNELVPREIWEHALVMTSYGTGIYGFGDIQPLFTNSSVYILHLHDAGDRKDLPPNAHHWYRYEYTNRFKDQYKDGLFLEWATDLNPSEIENNRPSAKTFSNHVESKSIVLVGTLWHRNKAEWKHMSHIASNHSLVFHQYGRVSTNIQDMEGPSFVRHTGYLGHREQYELMRDAFLTPAIQGAGHLFRGYVPCRIFKTVSAGKLGISNNRAVSNLFPPESIVVRHGSSPGDLNLLIEDALETLKNDSQLVAKINTAMTYVQQEHTYLARFNSFVNFIKNAQEGKETPLIHITSIEDKLSMVARSLARSIPENLAYLKRAFWLTAGNVNVSDQFYRMHPASWESNCTSILETIKGEKEKKEESISPQNAEEIRTKLRKSISNIVADTVDIRQKAMARFEHRVWMDFGNETSSDVFSDVTVALPLDSHLLSLGDNVRRNNEWAMVGHNSMDSLGPYCKVYNVGGPPLQILKKENGPPDTCWTHSFDCTMMNRTRFDEYLLNQTAAHPRVVFHPWCIIGSSKDKKSHVNNTLGEESYALFHSIANIQGMLGHDHVDLFKLDVMTDWSLVEEIFLEPFRDRNGTIVPLIATPKLPFQIALKLCTHGADKGKVLRDKVNQLFQDLSELGYLVVAKTLDDDSDRACAEFLLVKAL